MARSDLLLNLVRSATRQDASLFQRSVEALIAEERAKQHHVLADRLETAMRASAFRPDIVPAKPEERTHGLFHERAPRVDLDKLILSNVVVDACSELIEEHHRADLLRSYGIEPRNRVLLVGPPGNGKTSLAEGIAQALMVPFIVVRYEGVISSFLGETAAKLQSIFEYVRSRNCVLFFDEFDTIGKERGDTHETGEIKRVVSSLLMQIDDLPSHVVVITATNHPELLDRAVWRRFQLRLVLPRPTPSQVLEWLVRFETSLREPLGLPANLIAKRLGRVNFSELEEFATDIRRRHVLGLPGTDLKRIVTTRLRQWDARFKLPRTAATEGEG